MEKDDCIQVCAAHFPYLSVGRSAILGPKWVPIMPSLDHTAKWPFFLTRYPFTKATTRLVAALKRDIFLRTLQGGNGYFYINAKPTYALVFVPYHSG